jgi:cell division septum initiation protein DivIVA
MATIDDDGPAGTADATGGAGRADAAGGSRWRRKARRAASASADTDRRSYSGLGGQVEKILRLAEAEAADLVAEAERRAARIVEAATLDATRIRSAAEAAARTTQATQATRAAHDTSGEADDPQGS